MYLVWYPNDYGNPPAVAQAGATVGGFFYIRVVVQPISGYILSASVASSSLAEQTSAHTVTPTSPSFQQTTPNAGYGDPTSNVIVLQSLQNLADKHNGEYRAEVTVSYTVSTGSPPPNNFRTYTESGALTFAVCNLLVQDARTEPYFVWKSSQMTGVEFQAQLLHAQAGTCTVRLEIYRSDDNQNPLVTKEFSGVTRPGSWSWTWDGRLGDGAPAGDGVYLYRLSAYVPGSAPPDRDSNRSTTLFIRSTSLDFDYDAEEWIVACATNGECSTGKVLLFAPLSLQVMDEAPLEVASTGYCTRMEHFEAREGGAYIFLSCVWDRGDTDGTEKAHRRKPALPLNQKTQPFHVALVGMPFSGRTLEDLWKKYLSKCPPFRTSASSPFFVFAPPLGQQKAVFANITAHEARYYLNRTACMTDMWVAYTHGHGSYHGYGLEFRDKCFLWSCRAAPAPSNLQRVFLEDVAHPAPRVIMTGCWSGANMESEQSLVGQLRAKAVPKRVAMNRAIVIEEANRFLDAFFKSTKDQASKDRGNPPNFYKALQAGAKAVRDFLHSGVNLSREPSDPHPYNETVVLPND